MIRVRIAWPIGLVLLIGGLPGCAGGPGRSLQSSSPPPSRALRTNPPKWNWTWPWRQPAAPVASTSGLGKTPSSATLLESGMGRSPARVVPSATELSRYFPGVDRPEPVALARASRWGLLYNNRPAASGGAALELTSARTLQTAAPSTKRADPPRRSPATTGNEGETTLPIGLAVRLAPEGESSERLTAHETSVGTASGRQEPDAEAGFEPIEDVGYFLEVAEPPPLDEAVDEASTIPAPPPRRSEVNPDRDPVLRGRPRREEVSSRPRPKGLPAPLPAPTYPEDRSRASEPAAAVPTATATVPPSRPGLLGRLLGGRRLFGGEAGDVLQIR